jgi:arabinofuranosyltransferase
VVTCRPIVSDSNGAARVAPLPRATLVLWCAVPALALAVVYEIAAWRAAGTLGFPLDDAWIHAQFARNIATGHGFSYTGDRWVAGSTSPLWTLLLAAGYLVTRSILISATALGLALQILGGVLAARLVEMLTERRDLAVAGGLLVVFCPAMVWGAVSGMEVGLASVLVLAAFCCLLDPRRETGRALAAVALFAAASLARPEALVLVALCVVYVLARTRPIAQIAWRAAHIALILLAVLGPFVIFDYMTTGRPLPTTFYAKSGPGLVRAIAERNGALAERLFLKMGPEAVKQFGATLIDQFGAAAIAVPLGAAAAFAPSLRRRGAPPVVAAVLVSAYSMGLIAPQRLKPENFRYTAQLLALSAVVAAAGLSIWPIRAAVARTAIVAMLIVLVGRQTAQGASLYATSVRNIEQLQVTLGKWMHQWLPPDARVAVNDIGAVAFFSRREIVDLEGLVSPEALAYPRAERGIGFATATRPDYVAIFPFWYPDLSKRTDLFQEVHRISISGNLVSAGDTIVVYRTPWTRAPLNVQPLPARRHRWPE